jgi:hypothetical protein
VAFLVVAVHFTLSPRYCVATVVVLEGTAQSGGCLQSRVRDGLRSIRHLGACASEKERAGTPERQTQLAINLSLHCGALYGMIIWQ